MATTKTKKKGLSNPAVLAAASSPAGQKALDAPAKLAEAGIQLIPFLVKTGILVGGVWFVYNKFTNRFVKFGNNPNYPAANISDGQAEAKAIALYEAMYGFSANEELVKLQIAGLNWNGWVKVYNAFGNRKGFNPLGEAMNLVEWINDEFSAEALARLRFVLPNCF